MDKINNYHNIIKSSYLCLGDLTPEKMYQKREEHIKLKHINQLNNKSAIIEYEKIIRMAATIIRELGIENNPTSYCIAFIYLLWNGYFSINKEYTYESQGLANIRGYEGLDIVNGHGSCMNNVDLMKRIFISLGYKAYMIVNATSLYYTDYQLDNNIYTDSNILKSGKAYAENADNSPQGNHANLLLEKDNNYYIYDPTNKLIFKLDKMFVADLYNGLGKCYIKPWGLIVFEHFDDKQLSDLLYRIEGQDITNFLSDQEIKEITLETFDICHQNKTLILDFYQQILPHIEHIKKRI